MTTKYLGIWIDHGGADLIEATIGPVEIKTITLKFTHREKEESLSENEYLMRKKKQHEEEQYYKDLGDVIRNYDDILLFGPTDTKIELFYILKADDRFANTRIKLETTDNLTEKQKNAFVRSYFAEAA